MSDKYRNAGMDADVSRAAWVGRDLRGGVSARPPLLRQRKHGGGGGVNPLARVGSRLEWRVWFWEGPVVEIGTLVRGTMVRPRAERPPGCRYGDHRPDPLGDLPSARCLTR